MGVTVTQGDCRQVLLSRVGALFDVVITDPPYHLTSITERFGKEGAAPAKVGATGAFARASAGFMGEEWDGGDVAFQPETWRAIYDKMKPGAHLAAFGHSKNMHRLAVAIEDAGFEIRDTLFWLYGTGFPKSSDMSKAIDKVLGVERPVVGKETLSNDIRGGGLLDVKNGAKPGFERDITVSGSDEARQWEGWGTALKPAFEPIILARKPVSESSVARNVLKMGTGAVNIAGARIPGVDDALGRWPANILTDGSPEVVALFPDSEGQTGDFTGAEPSAKTNHVFQDYAERSPFEARGDSGSAARFFFSAKAGPLDRLGTGHATVKPVDLMRWLVRLLTPPGGLILDPFGGSGTTGIAAIAEGFDCELIELLPKHVADIERKLAIVNGMGRHTAVELHERKVREGTAKLKEMPLFGE